MSNLSSVSPSLKGKNVVELLTIKKELLNALDDALSDIDQKCLRKALYRVNALLLSTVPAAKATYLSALQLAIDSYSEIDGAEKIVLKKRIQSLKRRKTHVK